MDKNNNKPTIVETNFFYLIIALLLITVGAWAQSKEVYSGLFITEYIIILLPILLYLKMRGYSIRNILRLNRISLKQIMYVIFIALFSYPVAVFFNYIGIIIMSKFGEFMPSSVPIPTTPIEFLIGFFLIALTPGICEETMFRGMIMNSYSSLGRKKAIVYSAILFGIFHFNVQNLLGPIFLGILFGILVYKTNSIFASIIGHATNNSIALCIGFFTNNMEQTINVESAIIPDIELIYSTIVIGVMALLFWLIVKRLIRSIPTNKQSKIEEPLFKQVNNKQKMNGIEIVPILVVVLIFIVYNYRYFFV